MMLNRRVEEWQAVRPEGVSVHSFAQVVETLRFAIADIVTLTMERDAARAALVRFRAEIEGELAGLEAQTASSAGGGHNLRLTARVLGEFLDRMHILLSRAPGR